MTISLKFTFLFFFLTVCHSNGQEPMEGHEIYEKQFELTLKKDEEQTSEKLYKTIKFHWNDGLESSLEIFKQLECLDCPLSFGHIISRNFPKEGENNTHPLTTSHCQGSLIEEDLFLTARHCLPENLKSPRDSCVDNVLVILPRLDNNHSMKILKCDHLVGLSSKYEGLSEDHFQPDWAIIKLKDKVSKRFLIPDNRGGSNNENLFGFLPLENQETGEVSITGFQCKVIQNSLILPDFRGEKSPMAFLQCDRYMTNGFSGTTLFRRNEDQNYSPVVSFSHLLQEEASLKEGQTLQASKKIIASQIICMSPVDEIQESCEFHPNRRIEYQQQLVVESLQNSKLKIDRELVPWINENQPIKWQPVDLENWENLPEPYPSYLKKILKEIKSKLGTYGVYYLQNLIPVYPECIRHSFLSIEELLPEIPIQVPMIRISVFKDEHMKVVTQYKIVKLNAHLVLKSESSKETKDTHLKDRKFIINFIPELPLFEKPERTIISHQFSHSPAIIPVCPQT